MNVTKQCTNDSLELLWAMTQQSVAPKIKAVIESVQPLSFCRAASDCADICIVLAGKVRFKVYFWLCIHKVQGYWRGLSTSLSLAEISLGKWFKVIHEDIVTYIHCFFYIFAISHHWLKNLGHLRSYECAHVTRSLLSRLTYYIGFYLSGECDIWAPARSSWGKG